MDQPAQRYPTELISSKVDLPKPMVPLEVRLMYDSQQYRCEFRQGGAFIKATSGEIFAGQRGLLKDGDDRISSGKPLFMKLNEGVLDRFFEVINNGIVHVAGLSNTPLSLYTVHILIQPVANVDAQNVRYPPK